MQLKDGKKTACFLPGALVFRGAAVVLSVWLCQAVFPLYAASSQPLVFSAKCPAGGAAGEKLFEAGMDYEYARKGIEQDFFRAERFYQQALDKGSARAALYLGRLYRQSYAGRPFYTPRLRFQAALFEYAISMGCPDAYLFLAEAYQNGWGVKASLLTAWQLVKEGAMKGSMAAMTAWGTNLYFENRFEKGEQAQAMRSEAKAWLEKALKQGDGQAGYELALIYRVYERDPKNAVRVLREGARLGNVDCLSMLAGIYRRGEDGQPKDEAYAEAADALRREIDVREAPRPVSQFSRRLPSRPVLPYRAGMP
ncbi:MAG: hypothetical protein NC211_08500 [Alistipes senegalensis]|nr:hypothetical protein [Oxalobacter formigenes]MCM1281846.1 hypothetical protein [Alistipes senegalensis]